MKHLLASLLLLLTWLPPALAQAPLGMGLAPLGDWSTEQPFLDLMKTARPWIGHRANAWGGMENAELEAAGILDPDGWPMEIPDGMAALGTVILTEMPEAAQGLAGRYLLRFDGDGIVEVAGRARNVRYGPGSLEFDYTPGSGLVEVRITRTDRRDRGDYVRNIRVMRRDLAGAYDSGAIFNPDFLDVMRPFALLRFMDWMGTNGSAQRQWADRPRVGDASYARRGVPAEVMIALANTLGTGAWFNMPHMADDDYIRRFAALVAARLEPARTAYVEYSNEVWNWQFAQAAWADAEAKGRWNAENAWMQYYGGRAAEIATIWRQQFARSPERLVTVVGAHTAWPGLEADMLDAPLWRGEVPGRPAPSAAFDAYAVTGYFGHSLGSEENAPMLRNWLDRSAAAARDAAATLPADARTGAIERSRFDLATNLAIEEIWDGRHSGAPESSVRHLVSTLWPHHARVAAARGMTLIAYEAGTHIVGHGRVLENTRINDFFHHLNYTPRMGAIYSELLDHWNRIGGHLFTVYASVFAPIKWGSWGTLRHLQDDNPRWRALTGYGERR